MSLIVGYLVRSVLKFDNPALIFGKLNDFNLSIKALESLFGVFRNIFRDRFRVIMESSVCVVLGVS